MDQLHGMEPAVAWARSTLVDLAAWRAGGSWDDVDAGAVLTGPPGTGKTLFSLAFAQKAGMALVCGSLGRWQAEDAGHLGTTLRAMRRTFGEARELARRGDGQGNREGAVLFVDEIDSFTNRAEMRHDQKDYSVQIVNSFLELLDGAEGREGVILLAASNDLGRCDPAILRSGRMNRVIEIGLPSLDERLKMLRVRLGDDLRDADLTAPAKLMERATGADIERLVKDARRVARHEGRSVSEADLCRVAGEADTETTAEELRRTAIHEAGHAVVSTLESPADQIVVALQRRDGMAGWMERIARDRRSATLVEAEAAVRLLLAGRAAEELLLGDVSASARADLAGATAVASGIVGSWGLGGPHPLLSVAADGDVQRILEVRELRDAVVDILDAQYGRVLAILSAHERAVVSIAERLLEERRLDGSTVARLVTQACSAGAPSVRPRGAGRADAAFGSGA